MTTDTVTEPEATAPTSPDLSIGNATPTETANRMSGGPDAASKPAPAKRPKGNRTHAARRSAEQALARLEAEEAKALAEQQQRRRDSLGELAIAHAAHAEALAAAAATERTWQQRLVETLDNGVSLDQISAALDVPAADLRRARKAASATSAD